MSRQESEFEENYDGDTVEEVDNPDALFGPRLSTEEAKLQASLEQVLQDESRKQHFHEYLESFPPLATYIDLLDSLTSLRQTDDGPKRVRIGALALTMFVLDGSPNQVSLPKETRSNLEFVHCNERHRLGESQLYEQCIQDVHTQLRQSEAFRRYVQEESKLAVGSGNTRAGWGTKIVNLTKRPSKKGS